MTTQLPPLTIAAFATSARGIGFTDAEIATLCGTSNFDGTELHYQQWLMFRGIVSLSMALGGPDAVWLDKIGGGVAHESVRGRTARQMIAEGELENFIGLVESVPAALLAKTCTEAPRPAG